MNTRRSRSSPMSSSSAASRSGTAISCWASSSRPSSSCLRSSRLFRRNVIDGAMLRGGHEPGARVVRDARLRPLLERGDEGVLREFLGKTDVAHDPRETGDEPGRLDPPDCVDRAMCIGSRHGYRSHHLRSAGASRGNETTSSRPRSRALLWFGSEVFRPEHLANFGFTLPARPVFLVKFHETPGPLRAPLSLTCTQESQTRR